MAKKEQWRDVILDGKPYNYEVSNLGRLRGKNSQRVKVPQVSKRHDYHFYTIYDPYKNALDRNPVTSVRASRLIAEAFLGPRPPGMQVHHINGDTTDDRVTNLAYVTQEFNVKHSYATGTRRMDGKNYGRKYLTDSNSPKNR